MRGQACLSGIASLSQVSTAPRANWIGLLGVTGAVAATLAQMDADVLPQALAVGGASPRNPMPTPSARLLAALARGLRTRHIGQFCCVECSRRLTQCTPPGVSCSFWRVGR